MSPYIFVLCAEILAIKIRNNKNIKGITIGNTEFKLSQYADDASVILDGSDTSLNETLDELYHYAQYSGLKVNFDKTQVVWIGAQKYSINTIKTRWKLTWGKQEFKLLGLKFNVDLKKLLDINFNEKINKIKNITKVWKRRYLTPLGKITVIKTLLLPILNHLFISLPNPDDTKIKCINSIFYEFLWNGPAKIKQNVIVKEYIEGGLKMINLNAFINGLKATWIRRCVQKESKWSKIIEQTLNFKNLLSMGNFHTETAIKNVNNPF